MDAGNEVKDMGICYGCLERLDANPFCAGKPTVRAVCADLLGRSIEVKIRAMEILSAKPRRINIDPAKWLPKKTDTSAHVSDHPSVVPTPNPVTRTSMSSDRSIAGILLAKVCTKGRLDEQQQALLSRVIV